MVNWEVPQLEQAPPGARVWGFGIRDSVIGLCHARLEPRAPSPEMRVPSFAFSL